MSLEELSQALDVPMWTAARAMINLIEKGLVAPTSGTPEQAIVELRTTMDQFQPGVC